MWSFQLQPAQQNLQRLCAMAELRLLVAAQFCAHLAQLRQPEKRIVAETPCAALLQCDLAMPFSLGNQRLRVFGVMHQHQHAVVVRSPVGDTLHLPQ